MAPSAESLAPSLWYTRFAATVADHPDLSALVTPGETLTYRALLARAEAWHRDHSGETGRVVITTADPLEFIIPLLGAWRGGRPVALLAGSLTAETLEALRHRLALPVPRVGNGAPELQEALIVTTSGTTGLPKLVAHSHRSVAMTIDYLISWYGKPPGTRTLVAVPLHMVTGLAQVLIGLAGGWTIHAYPVGTPMPALAEALHLHAIQALPGPAAFYRVLMRYAPNQVFPDIVHLRCSGEPLEPELVAQMGAAFPNAQRTQAYGATDAGWRIAVPLPMTDPRVTQGAVGAPLPFFETRLEPLPDLPSGQGELYVRGPAVCLGYLSESGSHEGLTSDGWLSTRDIAELGTDGCLYIRGRVDVLFKSGGRWVNPVEVERLLGRLPGVAAARCFPKPHPLLGKAPVAEVVVNAGHALTPEALRDACLGQLEDHQLPREFHMVPEVSVGASGKKLRS